MIARLVSGTKFRTRKACERKTNLAPFHFHTVDCVYDLLQLYGCSTRSTLKPRTFPNANPLSQFVEGMGRSHNRRGINIPSPPWIEKGRMFNSMKNVEVS